MFDRISRFFSSKSEPVDEIAEKPIRQLYKLILLGDELHKTLRFRNNMGLTLGRDLIHSIGTDFSVRTVHLNSHETVAQIWEISQAQQFSNIRTKFMRGSRGAILIFDARDVEALLSYADILNEMYQSSPEMIKIYRNYPILLIACNTTENKFDRKTADIFVNRLDFRASVSLTLTIPDCNNFVSIQQFVDDLLVDLDHMKMSSAS